MNTGSLTFANPTAQTFSGALSGSGNLTKIGAGTMTLSGTAISFNGNITVSAGTLRAYNAVGPDGLGFSCGYGPFNPNPDIGPANILTINAGAVLEMYGDTTSAWYTSGNFNDGASISLGTTGTTMLTGNGVFRKTGGGVLSLCGDPSYGSPPYNGWGDLTDPRGQSLGAVWIAMTGGTIDIEGGTLRNGGWGNAIWTNNLASMNIAAGGQFDLWQGQTAYVNVLTGSGTVNDTGGYGATNSLVIGVNNGSGEWDGNISQQDNTVTVTKTGTGTEVFGAANTYTGPTLINGGALVVNGSLSSSGAVTVNGACTLSGSGAVGNITVLTGGTLAPGLAGRGTLTASSLVLNYGAGLAYLLGTGAGGDSLLAMGGGLTLNPVVTLTISAGTAWGNGTYPLTSGVTSLIDNSSGFVGWTVAGSGLGSHRYAFTLAGDNLDLAVTVPLTTTNWGASGGGSFAGAGNWSGGVVPSGTNAMAGFANSIGSTATTVTLDGNWTLGGLTFGNTAGGSYTLGRSSSDTTSTLTLSGGGFGAPVLVTSGSHTIAAPITLADNLNFNAAAGSSLTISGPIGGNYPVSVSGLGTLAFAAGNTYTGITAITGGTLQLNHANAVQDSTVMVADSGGLTFGTGVGTFNIGGLIGQSNGSFALADTAGNAVGITLGGNNASTTYSGGLSGGPGSGITKIGSGETTLSGPGINFVGNVTVNAGTLQVVDAVTPSATGGGSGFSMGTSTTGNTLTIASGAVLEMYVDTNTGWTYDGGDNASLGTPGTTTITGNGVFRKTGDGQLSCAGPAENGCVNMAMTGGTIDIEGGWLRNGPNAAVTWTNNKASLNIAAGTRFCTWGGQTVYIDALTGSGQIDPTAGNNTLLVIGDNNGSGTWTGEITYWESVTKTGAGTEVFATAITSYGGNTTLSGGVLQLNDPNACPTSNLVMNGAGSLAFGSSGVTYNVLSMTGTNNIALAAVGGGPVTLSTTGGTIYNGSLTGPGNLTKVGVQMLTLTASQSYAGATAITGGALMLAPRYTPGASSGVTLSNSGFEQLGPGLGGYWYNPGGLGWTFLNSSGVTGYLTAFGSCTPPEGDCCAFIQTTSPTSGGIVSQTLTFSTAGSYVVNFYSAGRTYNGGPNPFEVQIDGVNEGLFTPNYGWQQFTSNTFTVSAGTHTLAFVGEGAGASDQTSFIDAVSINQPGSYAANTNILPITTSVSLSAGGTLDLGGNNQQVASLADDTAGSGGMVVNSNTSFLSTLTLSAAGGTSTFSGQIAGGSGLGTINLVMTGSGTQVLAGSNTYTGATTINGGNLAVNGSLSPSSSVTVNSPGVLSGAGTVGSVTVGAHGTVAPGFGGDGTLTASSLSLAASSVLGYTLGSGTATDSRLGITGGLTLSTGLTLAITPAGSWGNGTYVLATYGSLANNSSSFSGWAVAVNPLLGRHTYGFSVSGVSSGSLDLTVGSAAVVNGAWNASGSGSWSTAGDWLGGNVPGYVGDTATFGTGIGSTAATVTLDGARGLSGLTLSTTGGGSYTLSRTGGDTASTLMLANAGSTVPLSVTSGSQTVAVPVALFDNVSVSVSSGASLTVSGAVGDGGAGKSLTVSGAGTLILAGDNSYTGSTTVTGGTLEIGAGGAGASLASPSVSLSGSTTLAFNDSDSITYSGVVTGNGGLAKQGAGTLTLGGSNTYGGGTTLSAGQLNLDNASALGAGTFTISGGTIGNTSGAAITLSTNNAQNWNGDFTFAGASDLNLGAGAVTMNASRTVTVASGNLIVGGVIGGSGCSLTKAGAGTLILGSVNNTYSGATSVTGGVLQLGVVPSTATPLVHFTFDGAIGTSVPTTSGAVVNTGSLGTAGNATMSAWGNLRRRPLRPGSQTQLHVYRHPRKPRLR